MPVAAVTLDAIGPNAEQLAMQAGDVTEIPVGWDPELERATFDSDTLPEAELQAIVVDALTGIDPEWRAHLRVPE
jgi:hypothetical protein